MPDTKPPESTTVSDRLLNRLEALYADRNRAEEVLDKIEADIVALHKRLAELGHEHV